MDLKMYANNAVSKKMLNEEKRIESLLRHQLLKSIVDHVVFLKENAMSIKVNVTILNHRPGDIIKEDSGDYERFLSWAEKKDRHQGILICEIVEEVAKEEPKESEESEEEKPKESEEGSETKIVCDVCGFEASNENGLKIHKSRAHKE
jgi:hypothetical protein